MKENFIHYLSAEPCQISINGKNIGVIDNINNFELDVITKTENVFVTYNPVSSKDNLLPYTYLLQTKDAPKTENEFIKVIPFPDNHYDVIMNPFYYYQITNSEVILNTNLDKFFVSIINDTMSKITVFSGASIVFTLNIPKLREAKAELKKDYIIVEGVISDETYYLLVIDTTNFQVLHNDISHSIENASEYIQSLKKLNNISHHAVVTKIDYTGKSKENFYVYEKDNATNPTNTLLIPKAFLECISIEDEKGAKSYLCDTYANTQIIQFKNYFGDIREVYLNRHTVKQNKVNYTILSDRYRNYNFIIENDKIIEIEEIF